MALKRTRLTTHFLQTSNLSITPLGKMPLSKCIKTVQKEHVITESSVLKELLELDEEYREYFKDWLSELRLQRMAAEKLMKLSRDYCVRAEILCTAPKHPISDHESIINRYQVHFQIILSSNSTLHRNLESLRRSLLAFRREGSKLVVSEDNPFIVGDTFHKPIKFFFDLAEELFSYFHCSYLKLDLGARGLDPGDLASIENYQKILLPCEEFEEYLTHNLGYCQCLRPSQPCPTVIRQKVTKSSELAEHMHRAQQKRCARRLAKMSEKSDEVVQQVPSKDDSTVLNLEHELRMHQLSMRLALLRQSNGAIEMGQDRNLVEQMIYALSPSLLPDGYEPAQGVSTSSNVAAFHS